MNAIVAQEYRTANKKATSQTVKLYNNLFRILPQGILFGHQDDLAYGLGWDDWDLQNPIQLEIKDMKIAKDWFYPLLTRL